MALQSCETPPPSSQTQAKLIVADGAPQQAVPVPDLEGELRLDPLKVTVDIMGWSASWAGIRGRGA